MIQVHVFYSGTVQGVGFRYTVHRYAVGLGLCGWVRNLPNGRVEITAEGDRILLEELMQQIEQRFDGYIRDKEFFWEESLENFKEFQITF